MEVFISWSGIQSGACAKALRDWLPCVMQTVVPWCSSEDIAKGARGLDDIALNLDKANFGIVCLTPSNLQSEWINFESGALSKKVSNSALFTLLLDLQPADIKPPLGLFQHTHASKEDVFKLTQAINSKTERPLSSEILSATFNALWPKLESDLSRLPADSFPKTATRPEREILEEILSAVRSQTQKETKSDSSEALRRKVTNLASFAEGCLQVRGHKAIVKAQLKSEDDALIQIVLDGAQYDFAVSSSSPVSSTKDRIAAFAKDTISDEDIPF